MMGLMCIAIIYIYHRFLTNQYDSKDFNVRFPIWSAFTSLEIGQNKKFASFIKGEQGSKVTMVVCLSPVGTLWQKKSWKDKENTLSRGYSIKCFWNWIAKSFLLQEWLNMSSWGLAMGVPGPPPPISVNIYEIFCHYGVAVGGEWGLSTVKSG